MQQPDLTTTPDSTAEIEILAENIGLSARKRPWAAICTKSASSMAASAAATVASSPVRVLASRYWPASCRTSSTAPGSPGPATNSRRGRWRWVTPAARDHIAALGATVRSRPASVGSAAHGTWWRAPVGTTVTGPSGRSSDPNRRASSSRAAVVGLRVRSNASSTTRWFREGPTQ